MGANNRAFDHQILVAEVGSQRLEHPFPHTRMAPAAEALVHSLPLPIAFWQVAETRRISVQLRP